MAAVELLAHRLMCLASALSRSRWAPRCGLRRSAAAPGLVLVLVVIELVLVPAALRQIDMAAKITLVLVLRQNGGHTFPDGGMDEGKIKKCPANPHGC